MPTPRVLYDLHSIPFTAAGEDILTFATVAELAAYDDSALADGTLAYVQSVRSYWSRRAQTNPATADGITNVQDPTNAATWYRQSEASPSWLNAASWYINEAAGSDEASGAVAAPLKTQGELARRIGDNRLTQNLTVTFVGAYTGGFSHVTAPGQQAGFAVHYRADLSAPVLAGTIAVFSPISYAGAGAPTNFTTLDNAIGLWNAAAGKIVIITAAADPAVVGAYAWVYHSIVGEGDVIVYTSPFMKPSPSNISDATVDPSNGDSYAVVDVVTLTPSSFFVAATDSVATAAGPSVTFENLGIAATDARASISGSSLVGFFGCDMSRITLQDTATVAAYDSWFSSVATATNAASLQVSGGLADGSTFITTGRASLTLGGDLVLLDAATVDIQSGSLAIFGYLCVTRVAPAVQGVAITLGAQTNASISGTIYGSGNTNTIVYLNARASVVDATSSLIATSTVATTQFGDITKGWADLPFINDATINDNHASWLVV